MTHAIYIDQKEIDSGQCKLQDLLRYQKENNVMIVVVDQWKKESKEIQEV